MCFVHVHLFSSLPLKFYFFLVLILIKCHFIAHIFSDVWPSTRQTSRSGDTLLNKTGSPFLRSYELSISPQIKMDLHVYCIIPIEIFVCFELEQVFAMQFQHCVWKTLSPFSHSPFLAVTLS